jgi:hypothetical protein
MLERAAQLYGRLGSVEAITSRALGTLLNGCRRPVRTEVVQRVAKP